MLAWCHLQASQYLPWRSCAAGKCGVIGVQARLVVHSTEISICHSQASLKPGSCLHCLCRAAWVESSQQQLSAAVGSLAAISLGLETMGTCIRASWTEEEEEALALGLRAYGRDFHAIQQDYVPTRTVHDLVDYYYNVWKLKATRQAVQWYQEKAQVGSRRGVLRAACLCTCFARDPACYDHHLHDPVVLPLRLVAYRMLKGMLALTSVHNDSSQ